MSGPVFRKEAIEHAGRRLEGEVVLWSPLPATVLAWGALATLMGVIAFLFLAQFPRSHAVRGMVTPTSGIVRIQAPRSGITQHLVEEGQIVSEGSALALIRRQSVIEGSGDAPSDRFNLIAGMEFEQREVSRRLDSIEAEIRATQEQRTLQQQRVDIARERLGAVERLAGRGFVASAELATRRSDALALEQAAASLDARVIALRREAGDLRARYAEIRAEYRTIVAAPMSGRIALFNTRPGQFVAEGDVIAVMEASQSLFEIELYVPSSAIGSIRVGQEVNLLYDAYPVQTFGAGRGQIMAVSQTVLAPEELSAPSPRTSEPVYRVTVKIDPQARSFSLRSGMQLTGDIVTERRSIIQWIAGPLTAGAAP